MIKSIRYFLLISLLLSITIAAAINGVGNYLLDEQVIQPYLDEQLVRVASLIDILYESSNSNSKIRTDIIGYLGNDQQMANEKFFFQVWDNKGNLILRSTNTQKINLQNSPAGFSDHVIQHDDWRIYTTTGKKSKIKIVVAEIYNLRHELGDDIAQSNANILLITYPVFGILVWFIISLALRSITRVTNEIANRASTFLEPVHTTEIPVEIKPLVAELNELLLRLKLAFERNKRFSADAAHELKTPLAALKTHVQVAQKARNDQDREKAMRNVIESVDRSSHVVSQLLTLSRLGEEESLSDMKPFDLQKLTIEIVAYLAPHALEKDIEIELAPSPINPIILGNDTAVGILIRNIVDNAIRYTPPQGAVKISITTTSNEVTFSVADTGTGIPLELRERVFERFFRILGSQASGSGLGLAIVSQISKLHHGKIRLSTPANGIGLQFDVTFPKYLA